MVLSDKKIRDELLGWQPGRPYAAGEFLQWGNLLFKVTSSFSESSFGEALPYLVPSNSSSVILAKGGLALTSQFSTVYFDGSIWSLGRSTTGVTAIAVTYGTSYMLVVSAGIVSGVSHGFLNGTYWASPSAGQLTSTKPTSGTIIEVLTVSDGSLINIEIGKKEELAGHTDLYTFLYRLNVNGMSTVTVPYDADLYPYIKLVVNATYPTTTGTPEYLTVAFNGDTNAANYHVVFTSGANVSTASFSTNNNLIMPIGSSSTTDNNVLHGVLEGCLKNTGTRRYCIAKVAGAPLISGANYLRAIEHTLQWYNTSSTVSSITLGVANGTLATYGVFIYGAR